MWRRLPTWFPNIKLVMLPLNPEEFTKLKNDGWLREVAFRTEPRVNKVISKWHSYQELLTAATAVYTSQQQ